MLQYSNQKAREQVSPNNRILSGGYAQGWQGSGSEEGRGSRLARSNWAIADIAAVQEVILHSLDRLGQPEEMYLHFVPWDWFRNGASRHVGLDEHVSEESEVMYFNVISRRCWLSSGISPSAFGRIKYGTSYTIVTTTSFCALSSIASIAVSSALKSPTL